MKKERRWLKSALAESAKFSVSMPWQRGNRRRPEALKSTTVPSHKPRALAAG